MSTRGRLSSFCLDCAVLRQKRLFCRLQFRQRLPSRCGRGCLYERRSDDRIAVFNYAAVYHPRSDDYCLLSRLGRPARRAAV